MTEAEWLTSDNVYQMVGFLLSPGRAVERKLRLFACGCCRRHWGLLGDARSRGAVEAAERYADGTASADELLSAQSGAEAAARDAEARFKAARCGWAAAWEAHAGWVAAEAAARAALEDGGRETEWGEVHGVEAAPHCLREAARDAARARGVVGPRAWEAASHREMATQALLLRDVFGNPFRPPPPLDARWLAWNGGAVRRLAAAVYEGRAFDRLPILADALEEAGCTDADLLGHLRGPGPHARGCWPVDLILGKR
jgi:hypothetical protein